MRPKVFTTKSTYFYKSKKHRLEVQYFHTSEIPSSAAQLQNSIVSQPSKCLKFMTFREICFVIRN